MTYTVIPDAATLDTFTEAMFETYWRQNLNAGVLRPIAETTLTATATTIDFQNLSLAAYRQIFVMLHGRGTTAAATTNVGLRFNGSTTSGDYETAYWTTNATTKATLLTAPDTRVKGITIPAASAPTSVFGLHMYWITQPAGDGSGWPTHVSYIGSSKYAHATGSQYCGFGASSWMDGSPITRITAVLDTGDFAIGSRVLIAGEADV